MTEEFYSALRYWQYTKLWGMANACGWANEPVEYVEAITAIESECNAMENEAMEKAHASSSKPVSNPGVGRASDQ